MASTKNGERNGYNLSNSVDCETFNGSSKDHVSLHISTSQKGLLSDEKSPKSFPENPTSLSSRLKLLKISPKGKMKSPSNGFHRIAKDRDELIGNDPLSGMESFGKRFKAVMHKKIDWHSVRQSCKEWVRKPLNMALLLWMVCVAISGAILFLIMTGMLNHLLPKKSQRNEWFEVNNQIINALFTLMCLYQHPKRIHHLVLSCRWKPQDISGLRKIYCKNGTAKPNERAHMMVVIILLHINCLAQYALCGLNLGYRRSNRPLIGVGICLLVAIATPAIAGLYCVFCPLGKDYDCDSDEEAPNQLRQSLEKRYAFATLDERKIVENKPEWRGGLFSLWEDFSVAYLSIFCCFCVFGWNMERLGFGNMYVHIATFMLFCMAPFWIFSLAAVNIDNDTVREILSITGISLCLFGLLYGGFWRIQMRKRFNLPANYSCFGKPNVADCVQWLCCCWCSLAQEVRTGDYYEITVDSVYRKNDYDNHTPLTALPREGSTASQSMSDMSSSFWLNINSSMIKPSVLMDETMMPPYPATMKKEAENLREM